jgi:hypothetical protein
LFCALSLGLVYISNANPACSCVYICKFQFRPIPPPPPPLGDYQGAHWVKRTERREGGEEAAHQRGKKQSLSTERLDHRRIAGGVLLSPAVRRRRQRWRQGSQ